MVDFKIKRSMDAKQFPLLHVKKAGDVGMDIPACLPLKSNWEKLVSEYEEFGTVDGKIITASELQTSIRETIIVKPGSVLGEDGWENLQRETIPTGIFLELPDGYWATIEARSSLSKQMLIVPTGIIDTGYRGELFAVVINVGDKPVEVKHGDRLVQLIIHKNHTADMNVVEVDDITPSERGASGFGSTGITS